MLVPQRIVELIESNRLTKKGFCEKVGISVQTLENVLKGSDIGSKRLEKIALFFGVSIDYFFDNEKMPHSSIGHSVNDNGNLVSGDIRLNECQREIEHLKELLSEKERTIQILLNKN
ncbi:helix-turn-helix transcriptional regulator [Phocaeicola plebeius]|uniref:helix-turn-helix domain-containing protein n=1 Tax=Phocaeicola plebeius TaxID=310297 RepID=UPI00307D0A5C